MFKAKTSDDLKNHIAVKHGHKDLFKCRVCEQSFSVKFELMDHRKAMHPNTVAQCKNYSKNTCPYCNERCWWIHHSENDKVNTAEEISCYYCNKTFESKSYMMAHRKEEHKLMVRICNKFLVNNCKFTDNACWFLHEK